MYQFISDGVYLLQDVEGSDVKSVPDVRGR